MLRNDFYTCHDIVQGDHEYNCRIVFNADHAIFTGHFPDHPVVPGVCMIEIVKELLQSEVNKPLMLNHADNVKFLQLITPGVEPFIKISWKESENGYHVNAILKSDSAVHFKLSGQYNDSMAQ